MARLGLAHGAVRHLGRREKYRWNEDAKGGAGTVEKPARDWHGWHEHSGGARGVGASTGKWPALWGFEGSDRGGTPGDGSDGAWEGRSVERSAASRRNRHESPALEKKTSGKGDEDAAVVARDFKGGIGRRRSRHVSPETKEKRGRGLPAFVWMKPQRRSFFSAGLHLGGGDGGTGGEIRRGGVGWWREKLVEAVRWRCDGLRGEPDTGGRRRRDLTGEEKGEGLRSPMVVGGVAGGRWWEEGFGGFDGREVGVSGGF